jgi:hypothetical protein
MPDPLWTILAATLASRQAKFTALMDCLLPQAEAAGCIEVIACHNNGERPLGDIRQALLMAATGEYVSFVDDDDEVPGYFCEAMVPALRDGPDVVGFRVEYHEGGRFAGNCYHSLAHTPRQDGDDYYRDLTHLQPVRTVLAQRGDFRAGWPEDGTWRKAVRPLLESEAYIDQCMYVYRHDWGDTVQGALAPHTHTPRPVITSPVFRWLDIADVP